MIPVERKMRSPISSREIVRWVGAMLAAVLTTAALERLGANATTAGMLFLVLVVWSATQAGLVLSLAIATFCALAFDYFFLPPYHTFGLSGVQAWAAMFAFAASSVAVGRVAERARRQARQSEQRREDVERLYTLSQEMMLHEDAGSLVHDLPHLMQRIFALESVAIYVRDRDEIHASLPEWAESAGHILRRRAAGDNPMAETEDGFTAQALMLGMRAVGALGWRPARLSPEVATAVSAQVAIALTRAMALETTARMEAARESERLRTALIDSLTHELRTPLTSIRAAATTLMQGEGLDDATRADLASIVDEESSRLDTLIGEAVEMAEIDAHVVRVRTALQHTRSLFEQAVEESRAVLGAHRVHVEVEAPDEPVWFDAHLLGRVLRHLLENAARYSPPGSEIVLRSRRSGARLEFLVEDNGPGIDTADLPLIFEKFYRGREGRSRRKGSGMGLAIARAMMTAHGGSIEVTSQRGRGASFLFWVPLAEKEPTQEGPEAPSGNRKDGAERIARS